LVDLLPPRFRVIRTLGKGGDGEVHLVQDQERSGQLLALKGALWRRSDPSRLEGLAGEFARLGSLAHPGITAVRDFGYVAQEPDGICRGAYFTSDYVPGGDLLSWSNSQQDGGLEFWSSLALQALAALSYLERRGVRHGDIKPQNLIVDAPASNDRGPPRLVIVDFGSSRLRSLERDEPATGTRTYLPPSPSDGADREVDAVHDVDPDLFGLGMSLFHAYVGHLPFPLNDHDAQRDWWQRGGAASPAEWNPGVPKGLDQIVRRLTSRRSGERFSGTAEALTFLERSAEVHRAQVSTRGRGQVSTLHGGASQVNALLGLVERGPQSVIAVGGPTGRGKTRLLEALRLRLELEGWRTVAFESPQDPQALGKLLRLCGGEAGTGVSFISDPSLAAAELIARCLEPCAVLIDNILADGVLGAVVEDATEAQVPQFLASVVQHAAENPGSARRICVVAASRQPDTVVRCFRLSGERVKSYLVEPLNRQLLGDLAADFFAVERVPDHLLDAVEGRSGGSPGSALDFLRALAANPRVRVDFLGELESPPEAVDEALERSSSSDGLSATVHSLPTGWQRALALVQVAAMPLSAAEAGNLFDDLDVGEWQVALQGLSWNGLVRVWTAEPAVSYRTSSRLPPNLSEAILGPHESTSLRRKVLDHLSARMAAPSGCSAEVAAAAATQCLRLGEVQRGCLFALRARRLLAAEGRASEALELLAEILRESNGHGSRSCLVACLRSSDLARSLGRSAEARRSLESLGPPLPGWVSAALQRRRALLDEDQGNAVRAISAWEALRNQTRTGRPNPAAADQREIACRLARLHFQAGDTAQAGRELALSRKLFDQASPRENPLAAAILALGSSVEAAHGDGVRAMRYLEAALQLVRRQGSPQALAAVLRQLGALHTDQHRFAEARECYAELEVLLEQGGERMGRLQALYNRAILHYRSHDAERAETLLREACRLSESMGQHAFSSTVWLGLAGVLREQDRLAEAVRLYRRVLRSAALARKNDLVQAHNNLGEIYGSLGRLRRSLEERQAAVSQARSLGSPFLLGLGLRGLGAALIALGRLDEAEAALEECLHVQDETTDRRHLGGCLYYLGRLQALRGRGRDSSALFLRARRECRRVQDRVYEEAATLAIVAHVVERGRRQIASRLLAAWRAAARPLPMRSPLEASALELRSSASWPSNVEQILDVVRQEQSQGRWWPAFLAVREALADRLLDRGAADRLQALFDFTVLYFRRWMTADDFSRFREFWAGDLRVPALEDYVTGGRDEQPASEHVPSSHRADGLVTRWVALDSTGDARSSLDRLLVALREALPASAVWTVNAPQDAAAFFGSEEPGVLPRDTLERAAGLFRQARTQERAVLSGGDIALSLRGDGERYLYARAPAGGWRGSDVERVRLQFECAGASVELLFALMSREADLDRERTRLRDSLAEGRRLSTLLSRSTTLLDTAPLSGRRSLVVQAQRPNPGQAPPSAQGAAEAPHAASRPMKLLMSRLPTLAESDLSVLILGESGVGKDSIARWIHHLSPRREKPFLAEICSAPESLIETELFGVVRGAYTDAVADRPGLFQSVTGGTLYLSEVSDLTPMLQARLLRVLATKRVRPVGSEEDREVEFRLLASSRWTRPEELKGAVLREDLFYRMQGEVIRVPPLRERPEDLVEFVNRFVVRFAAENGTPPPYVHPRAMERLLAHGWPGNFRELETVLRRALFSNPREILPDQVMQLNSGPTYEVDVPMDYRTARNAFERNLVLSALRRHQGNASRAAESLGISRRYLGKLLEKHRIDLESFRND
jgi:DNA-binding NtrC family response regulator/tetratricopeptide (TPR) repeat protein